MQTGQMFIARRKRSDGANSVSLEDALEIAQHHDAITGNAKQHTINDYAKHVAFGASEAKIGRKKECETALQNLRGEIADISQEAAEIREMF
nr:putative alpha-mannosidase [Quercus suber]